MFSKRDIASTRDQVVEQGEHLMRRADDIRERFVENIDKEQAVKTAGRGLLSAGISLGLTQWFRGRRRVSSLLLPAGLLLAGISLMSRGVMQRRGWHLDEAVDGVRSRLSSLPSIPRVQVLRTKRGFTSLMGR